MQCDNDTLSRTLHASTNAAPKRRVFSRRGRLGFPLGAKHCGPRGEELRPSGASAMIGHGRQLWPFRVKNDPTPHLRVCMPFRYSISRRSKIRNPEATCGRRSSQHGTGRRSSAFWDLWPRGRPKCGGLAINHPPQRLAAQRAGVVETLAGVGTTEQADVTQRRLAELRVLLQLDEEGWRDDTRSASPTSCAF